VSEEVEASPDAQFVVGLGTKTITSCWQYALTQTSQTRSPSGSVMRSRVAAARLQRGQTEPFGFTFNDRLVFTINNSDPSRVFPQLAIRAGTAIAGGAAACEFRYLHAYGV
jgi:hypothetical protein